MVVSPWLPDRIIKETTHSCTRETSKPRTNLIVKLWFVAVQAASELLHIHDARDRLDGAGDLRRDLEAAGQLHLDLGLEVEHHDQRDLAVAVGAGRGDGTADLRHGAVRSGHVGAGETL